MALGSEGTVAELEAERVLLDRLPAGAEAAIPLDTALGGIGPRVSRTVAQDAVKKLMELGTVRRLGKGKKSDSYRYYRPAEDSAGTQITKCGRNGDDDGPRSEEAVAP